MLCITAYWLVDDVCTCPCPVTCPCSVFPHPFISHPIIVVIVMVSKVDGKRGLSSSLSAARFALVIDPNNYYG